MRKSPVSCPVCHKEIAPSSNQFVCVEVKDRSCRVVKMKDVPGETKKIICLVHEACAGEFEKIVAAGKYPPEDSK